ncbi:DUF262 domain-containing protein [Cereibacter johrii]|uniref:DUF262 domain-containing protein n=1 Tax=Cereibacter johrii TaxID=445629 RepID=UPI000DD31D54|nr:DUF262 domain-containing protein [Cereibacter johrii]
MTEFSSDSLERQIEEARMSVSADGYPMSIGELTNMYREGELIIRPAFQRFFRWNEVQKSNLVESIILGIPIPSVFVSQNEAGKWEVVDGLQRISTILELQGELIGVDGKKRPPLQLTGTKYLPALEGCIWDGPSQNASLSNAHRLDFKRSKIDLKIIKRTSSKEAKYDLFQRLNNYGSRLSPQEIRSALLVAVSPDFYEWVEVLARSDNFTSAVQISDRLIDERYDLELVLKFFMLCQLSGEDLILSRLRDFNSVLDDFSVRMASEYPGNRDVLEHVFEESFRIIQDRGGPDLFRKWDKEREEFRGAFLNTAFEIFAAGIGYNVMADNGVKIDLLSAAKEFWALPGMQSGFATGKSTEWRLSKFVPIGRELTKA